LPDAVRLNNPDLARRVYAIMEAFEWRFLPSQILAEDEALMDDLATLRWLSQKVRYTLEADHG